VASTEAELAAAAGVQPAVLAALRAVESGNNPSAIRFEPHLFIRLRPDLASRIPYTPGEDRAASPVGAETNRAAFNHAYELDARIAVKSTSWGLYQVLGGRLLTIFDNDPDRAVRSFYADPEEVSKLLLVQWMRENPAAVRAANAEDWGEFVHRFNGCTDCTRYLSRFMPALEAAQGGSFRWWIGLAALGTVVIGTAAAFGVSYRPKRKTKRRRR
jgi:hypothetical protein